MTKTLNAQDLETFATERELFQHQLKQVQKDIKASSQQINKLKSSIDMMKLEEKELKEKIKKSQYRINFRRL